MFKLNLNIKIVFSIKYVVFSIKNKITSLNKKFRCKKNIKKQI